MCLCYLTYGVYPRVGGGTDGIGAQAEAVQGLSPRGRGNPQTVAASRSYEGSIPAWAGEPRLSVVDLYDVGVYPRVGGGTQPRHLHTIDFPGLSPRGRGNRPHPQQR